jgi:hypothetical protein
MLLHKRTDSAPPPATAAAAAGVVSTSAVLSGHEHAVITVAMHLCWHAESPVCLQPGTSLQPACPPSCILANAAADDDASAAARPAAFAAEDGQTLCDASCVSKLEAVEAVTTPSGLQYKDIIVGTGEAAAASHDKAIAKVCRLPFGPIASAKMWQQRPHHRAAI